MSQAPEMSSCTLGISVSVNSFMEQITNVKAVERTQPALRLNADDTNKVEYKVGDKVIFFLPTEHHVHQQI